MIDGEENSRCFFQQNLREIVEAVKSDAYTQKGRREKKINLLNILDEPGKERKEGEKKKKVTIIILINGANINKNVNKTIANIIPRARRKTKLLHVSTKTKKNINLLHPQHVSNGESRNCKNFRFFPTAVISDNRK